VERRKNRFDVLKDTWVDRYFDLPCIDRAFLVGFLAMLLGFGLDQIAHLFGYPWYAERLLSNAVEGVVIGAIVYWLSALREKRMERRMREIGYLNHHIRNAMQTIAFATMGLSDEKERDAVIDLCVRRVTDALSRLNREHDVLIAESSILAV
jgi:hypothetical protein